MKPGERHALVTYRIKKARKTFNEVDLHTQNKLWNTAINRLYYAVSALLINEEIYTQTHAGARQMFGLNFIKTGGISKELGKFYSDIFDKRQTSDYEDFTDYSKEDVMGLIAPANELITKIENMLKV